jgi:hypothetical protein
MVDMEDKLTMLKERLTELHYNCYQHNDDDTWEYDHSFDIGFIQCASLFLSIDEMEECKNTAWNRYMTDEGYTQEQADEVKKETLETLQAGIRYLQENPNATFLDLEKGDA